MQFLKVLCAPDFGGCQKSQNPLLWRVFRSEWGYPRLSMAFSSRLPAATRLLWVWSAIAASVEAVGQADQIAVRTIACVATGMSRPYLQHDRVGIRAILKMVAIRLAGFESGAVTRVQGLITGLCDQHDLAREHVDELILVRMPMALR